MRPNQPQFQQLCWSDGEIALDYVGRYENLQASYDAICDNIGVSSQELGQKNASKHASFTSYYDDYLREKVANFYAEDLRIFDYEFPTS